MHHEGPELASSQKLRQRKNDQENVLIGKTTTKKTKDKNKAGSSRSHKKQNTTKTKRHQTAMAPFSGYDQGEFLDFEDDDFITTTTPTVEVKQQQQKPIKTRQKADLPVGFNPVVKVIHTLHINDYTEDEIDACWYNEREVKAIRDDAKVSVELLKNGKLEQDTEEHCRRGSECQLRSNRSRRRKLKAAGWLAVLREQEEQFEEGMDADPYCIAHVYKSASSQASDIARAVALKDELDALMWYTKKSS